MKTEDSLEKVKPAETITDTISAGMTSLNGLKLNFKIMNVNNLKDCITTNPYYFTYDIVFTYDLFFHSH